MRTVIVIIQALLMSPLVACSAGSTFVASATGGASGMSSGGSTGIGGATSAGGDMSTGGTSGYESMSCAELQAAYATELATAKTCEPTALNACDQTVPDALDCACPTYVSNTRTGAIKNLEQIRTAWDGNQCSNGTTCPAIACVNSTSANCVASATVGVSGVCTPNAN